MKIKLNTFDKIKAFAQKVIKFESDINICKGSIVYDAKSIMGVMALDTSEYVEVEILSKDNDEIKKFKEEMGEFA